MPAAFNPLLARFSIAPAGSSSLQTEFVLVFASPTQLSTSISDATAAEIGTLFSISPAGSRSLQTEFVLVLTCIAQAPTILGIARRRKYHEK
jgi:hypothetical protein